MSAEEYEIESKYHFIEAIHDEEKFRVLTTKCLSGTKWQWAVSLRVDMSVKDSIHVRDLNRLLYKFLDEE